LKPIGLFSKFLGGKQAPSLDLEDLIYEIAEHQRYDDFQELFRRMMGREVFVPVVRSTVPAEAKPDQSITTDNTHSIQMRSVASPNGRGMLVPCATRQDVSILNDGYVGMTWEGILEMALKVGPPPYGVLIQGHRSWVAIDPDRVRHLLRDAPRR
jgi:hypothetical protein